jgi:hypothetical protein
MKGGDVMSPGSYKIRARQLQDGLGKLRKCAPVTIEVAQFGAVTFLPDVQASARRAAVGLGG